MHWSPWKRWFSGDKNRDKMPLTFRTNDSSQALFQDSRSHILSKINPKVIQAQPTGLCVNVAGACVRTSSPPAVYSTNARSLHEPTAQLFTQPTVDQSVPAWLSQPDKDADNPSRAPRPFYTNQWVESQLPALFAIKVLWALHNNVSTINSLANFNKHDRGRIRSSLWYPYCAFRQTKNTTIISALTAMNWKRSFPLPVPCYQNPTISGLIALMTSRSRWPVVVKTL